MNEARFRPAFDSFMEFARANGVGRTMMICCSYDDLEWTLAQMAGHPELDCAFGFHPEDVDRLTADDWARLEGALADPRVCAVGEVGLDYYWTKGNAELQKQVFIRQVELAARLAKPLLIHSRAASQDTFDILAQYGRGPAVMHCYSGSTEMMERFLGLGCYISFAGPVTFKKSVEPKANAAAVPLDRLLIETDCPYMAPEPMRGRDNQTAYVRYVGEFIAGLRGIEPVQLQQAIMANYFRLLGRADG